MQGDVDGNGNGSNTDNNGSNTDDGASDGSSVDGGYGICPTVHFIRLYTGFASSIGTV